jgi:hypothetical protein
MVPFIGQQQQKKRTNHLEDQVQVQQQQIQKQQQVTRRYTRRGFYT